MDETHKVNVEFPQWMIEKLDKEAERLKIPRQAVIKILLDQALEERERKAS
jgi:metal-responsive CopG/Arc/MetJ family transcriptional regulator